MTAEWHRAHLGDVTTKIGSGATPRGGQKAYKSEGISLIRSMNVHDLDFRCKNLALIDQGQANALSNVALKEGDVLLNITGASIARCCCAPSSVLPARVNQHVCIIRARSDILNPRFLAMLLTARETKLRLLNQGESGATRQALTKAYLTDFEITFPPLDEQKRIVAILDEAFAGIAIAKANTEKNLQNARYLFESQLRAIFNGGIEPVSDVAENNNRTGHELPLVDLCRVESGGTPSKSNTEYWKGSTPWVSGKDLKSERISDAVLHISDSAIQEGKSRMAPIGSLLVLVRGMGLANGFQVAEVTSPCAYNQDIKALIPLQELNPTYLTWALRTRMKAVDDLVTSAAHGTLKINTESLERVLIPIPPLTEQSRVASVVDETIEANRTLTKTLKARLILLEQLGSSLLNQAFAGQL